MTRPSISSLRVLSPLPKHLWESNCILCDKRQARWTVRAVATPVFICSLCLLYGTTWGAANQSQALHIQTEIERSRPAPFPMQDGKLRDCADADSVMGVLVLVERTVARMPHE